STWMTGGMRPSLVLCMSGSTPSVPSSRHQNFHMGTSSCTVPSAPLTEMAFGSSTISPNFRTQGPAPTTTVSQGMVPLLVMTPVTEPECEPYSKPLTSTPVAIRTPSASALPAKPYRDAVLLA